MHFVSSEQTLAIQETGSAFCSRAGVGRGCRVSPEFGSGFTVLVEDKEGHSQYAT